MIHLEFASFVFALLLIGYLVGWIQSGQIKKLRDQKGKFDIFFAAILIFLICAIAAGMVGVTETFS